MYLHPLPPSPVEAVDFSSHLLPTSSSATSPAHLARSTQLRQALCSVLAQGQANGVAGSSNSSSGGSSTIEVKLIQAIEEYLPCLIALYNCCQTDDLIWRSEAHFVWYAYLNPPSTKGKTKAVYNGPFASTSLLWELDNVIVLYSLALSNLAALQAISVGNYEQSKTLSEADRKTKEAALKRGVAYGKKAVEVMTWLSDEIRTPDAGQEWSQEYEASRRQIFVGLTAFHRILPTILTLRSLLSPSLCLLNSTQQQPPPLPKGHPSPSLLAKLYLEIPRLVDETRSHLNAGSGGALCSGSKNKISQPTKPANSAAGTTGDNKLAAKFKGLGIGKKNKTRQDGRGDALSANEMNYSASVSPKSRTARPPDLASVPMSASDHPRFSRPPSAMPVSPMLALYLEAFETITRSTAFTYLALAAGEESSSGGSGGRHGEAIVWLRMAKQSLDDLLDNKDTLEALVGKVESKGIKGKFSRNKDDAASLMSSSSSLSSPYGDDEEESSTSWKPLKHCATHPFQSRVQSHHAVVYTSLQRSQAHCTHIYARLNDSVSFQPLPNAADLAVRLPGPRSVLTFSKDGRVAGDASGSAAGGGGAGQGAGGWAPPRPEFGPGSLVEAAAAGTSGRNLDRGDHMQQSQRLIGASAAGTGGAGDDSAGERYVGSGAYY